MAEPAALPVHRFDDRATFNAWLAVEHASSRGIWLEVAKKGNPTPSITYAEGVEVALCFGWIDGQRATSPVDGWFRQRFTPRTTKSPWSKINRNKVEALAAAGRLAPSGVAAVDAAKADGRWERAYAGQATMEVPADLQAALDGEPSAASFFATLRGANRYAVLYRIQDAKRPETRARRISTFVAMLARGETLH